jgi:hypothetical protein
LRLPHSPPRVRRGPQMRPHFPRPESRTSRVSSRSGRRTRPSSWRRRSGQDRLDDPGVGRRCKPQRAGRVPEIVDARASRPSLVEPPRRSADKTLHAVTARETLDDWAVRLQRVPTDAEATGVRCPPTRVFCPVVMEDRWRVTSLVRGAAGESVPHVCGLEGPDRSALDD